MPTLYVENIPEDLYEALRRQAREHRRSIAQEVIDLLGQLVPTEKEMDRRKQFLERMLRQAKRRSAARSFPSTEQMIREDRER